VGMCVADDPENEEREREGREEALAPPAEDVWLPMLPIVASTVAPTPALAFEGGP